MYFAVLAVLVVLCCIGAGVPGKGKIFDDYMSQERTTSIKGVFAVIIVMSHMLQYISTGNPADRFAATVIAAIGQLMVTMFFFYSGYGIAESCRSKPGYMSTFFKNRILKTLVHFDLAVLLFLLLNLILDRHYSLDKTLLAFTGWTSIGNSNWFVFCTLALYLIALPVFALIKKHRETAVAVTWVLTVVLAVVLRAVKGDYWWYNTLLCYPLGMVWSLCRRGIEKRMSERIGIWWAAMIGSLAVFAGSAVIMVSKLYNYPLAKHFEWLDQQYFYMIFACIFCIVVVISQMRLRTHNKVLYWLGINSFSIYILQRLPMIILKQYGIHKNAELFITVAIAATMLIAPAFTWLIGRLDRVLFPKKQKQQKNKGE